MSERESLSLKWRPARFSDLVGQTATAAVLFRMCASRKLPKAILLHGARGCGKTSTARIIGASLNCEQEPGHPTVWPCGVCPSCKAVASDNSLDVRELDAASNGGIDQIRALRTDALFGTAGEWRVFIVDECHGISGPGFDAMLKLLEEPPPQTLFILLTTEYGKVPATIRSRCMKFPFRLISEQAITARLAGICTAEGIPAEEDLLAAIAEDAEGGMRDAIMQLDQVTSIGITSLAMWRELTGAFDFAPALIAAAAEGNDAGMYGVLDQALSMNGDLSWIISQVVRCLKDLCVLTAGAPVAATGEALERRRQLAGLLGPVRLKHAMKVLWDLQTRVRTEDRKFTILLAVSALSQVLCPVPPDQVAALPSGPQPAGIDSVRGMLA